MSYIGESHKRVDALGKVTGETLFSGDFNLPDQLYMKVLFAFRPHAIIKSIDFSEAENHPGVVALLTAKDVPVNEYGLGVYDQPVLCGPGSAKLFAERVRFIGDQVAVVVAESEKIAAEALKLIRVEYEDLPVIVDPFLAREDQSMLIHPDRDSNILSHYKIRKGDVESAFSKADVIVENEYRTPVQEHAFLQPEAGIAYYDEEERITVVCAGQWAHEEREQIAHALGMPEEKIRVIHPAMGGAFGGREDISIQIVLALAVKHLDSEGIRRPVKLIWTRQESMIGHFKRHPYIIKAKWGATKEGKVIAAEAELVTDAGAYAYTSPKVMGNATLMVTGPYEIPNVKVDSFAVYTNNIPNGAFRGFGGPQGAFAAEGQMNKLAERLGLDPVEIRMKNVLKEGSLLSVNSPAPKGVTISEVIEDCALASGWENKNGQWSINTKNDYKVKENSVLKRGIGFACSFKNIGFSFGAPESCEAIIELYGKNEIEYAVVHHAGADVGQGAHTVFAQMAASALDIPIEKIRLAVGDTAAAPNSGSSSASRMTFMSGNAIKGAAELALKKWRDEERPVIAHYNYHPPKTTPFDKETGECNPNYSYGYVAEAVEIEVDVETGQIHIVNVVCSDDVGKAINPSQIVGQIEGAIVQAAGYTVLENFIQQNGKVLTDNFSTYLIPTVLDIPDNIESRIMEFNDPLGPWGARGMGEMPYLPFAPAVIAALHDATGIWMEKFPLTPEAVLEKLEEFSEG